MDKFTVTVHADTVLNHFRNFQRDLPHRKDSLVRGMANFMYYKVRSRMRYTIGALSEGLKKKHEPYQSLVWVRAMQSRRQEILSQDTAGGIPYPHKFKNHPLSPDWEFAELVDDFGAYIPRDKEPFYKPDQKWPNAEGFFTDSFNQTFSNYSNMNILANIIKDYVN